jgi:hypothetical protein
MPRFKGFNASVVVDGVDLSEYEETGSETTTADGVPQKTVYIESQTGRRFMLRFKVSFNSPCRSGASFSPFMVLDASTRSSEQSDFAGTFRVRTWIDGQQLNGSVISRGDEHVKKGRLQGSGALAERQPLVFAPLKLVSDLDGVRADALFEEQKNGNVKAGQIKLEFWDYAVLGREAVKDKVPRKQAAQIEVHEKAKKGAFLSHTSGETIMCFCLLGRILTRELQTSGPPFPNLKGRHIAKDTSQALFHVQQSFSNTAARFSWKPWASRSCHSRPDRQFR